MVCAHKLRRMQQFHLSFSSIDRLETSRGSVCQITQPKLALKHKIRPLLRNVYFFCHVIAHSFRQASSPHVQKQTFIYMDRTPAACYV